MSNYKNITMVAGAIELFAYNRPTDTVAGVSTLTDATLAQHIFLTADSTTTNTSFTTTYNLTGLGTTPGVPVTIYLRCIKGITANARAHSIALQIGGVAKKTVTPAVQTAALTFSASYTFVYNPVTSVWEEVFAAPTGVVDIYGNDVVIFTSVGSSAVNEVTITNSLTASGPIIGATGAATDIDLNVAGQGDGLINANSNLNITKRWYGKSLAATAANDMILGLANQFIVAGNTQINAIDLSDSGDTWTAGSQITLIFTGTPTVKHNTAGGAGTNSLKLAGSADFVAAADSVLGLEFDGTYWQESFRKVA